ncbi:MAG: sulfite exporter TauE/SafE family protein [Pirellulales bacterium]|nr:sulfite exporter TauE/SafE family protein [Pirellulales bacterium]
MELLEQAAIGLLAGLFGGLLGVGGSVAIIPGLIFYLDQTRPDGYTGTDQHLIQAAAMICNVFVVAPSVLPHWRARAVMPSVVVGLIPSALVGMLTGVAVSNSSSFARENGVYLAMILAGFLLYVAVYNTMRLFSQVDLERGFDPEKRFPTWRVVAVGIPMGFAAGLLGIGGGALAVPIQQLVLRLPLRRAIANSAVTIVVVSCIGAIHKNITLPNHGVSILASIQLAAMLIPTAILGSYVGGMLTHTLPRRALRVVFVIFMTSMAYLTFSRAWNAAVSAPNPSRAVHCEPVQRPAGTTCSRPSSTALS